MGQGVQMMIKTIKGSRSKSYQMAKNIRKRDKSDKRAIMAHDMTNIA